MILIGVRLILEKVKKALDKDSKELEDEKPEYVSGGW